MRVLVLETDRNTANDCIRALRSAGHEVVRCHEPGSPTFPCNALRGDQWCPFDQPGGVDVAVTVRAHPYPRPTPLEGGVVCALRRDVPLVVAGTSALNPYEPWTAAIAEGHDILTVVEAVAGGPLSQPAATARVELQRLLEGAGMTAPADVTVHRIGRRLTVEAVVPNEIRSEFREAIAVRLLAAVCGAGIEADQIDVRVLCTP